MSSEAPVSTAAPRESIPGRIARAVDRFLFTPTDPATLGLMRIFTGLIVLYVHFSYGFELFSYVTAEHGWLDQITIDYLRTQMPMTAPSSTWAEGPEQVAAGQYLWSIYYHVQDPQWIYAIHGGFFLILILFTVGLWTPVTAVLAWVAALSYVHRAPTMLFGMDAMLVIGLFYLMLGPSGSAYSVDRLLERRRARRESGDPARELPVPHLPSACFILRLVQVHFCIIYLAAGLSKLLGASWWGGTAIWGTVANYSFAPMDFPPYYEMLRFLTQHRYLWEIAMSAGVVFTLVMEIGLPFLVWVPSLRGVMVGGSALLHLGIGLFMGLVTFSMMMMVLCFSFVPPAAIRRLTAQLTARWQPRREPGPAVEAPADSTLVAT